PFYCYRPHRAPPSSPTRRSSDLEAERLLRHSFGQFQADARRTSGAPAPSLYADRFRRLVAVLEERGYLSEGRPTPAGALAATFRDRKSTRLNSSHVSISYAVFCL